MRPVIRVSLNGHALQLEDDAHASLTQYLESAARTLDGNPDRAEILADLEQSIAEKSARFLVGGRDVLNREQVGLVLDEVGPVEPAPNGVGVAAGGGGANGTGAGARVAGGAAHASAGSGRGLHQISDGAVVSGLCNGIAAWASMDVTIVRIVAVILAFATGGAAVLAYVLLMFIVPYANDGRVPQGLPRASRSLVERLRGQTAEFARSDDWQRFHSDARHTWNRGQARVRREWEALRRPRAASSATSADGQPASTPVAGDAGEVPAGTETRRETSWPSPAVVLALVVLLIAVLALG